MWTTIKKRSKTTDYKESAGSYYDEEPKSVEVEIYSCTQKSPVVSSFSIEPTNNGTGIITDINHHINTSNVSSYESLMKNIRKIKYNPTIENSIAFVQSLLKEKLISTEIACELSKKIDKKNIEKYTKEFEIIAAMSKSELSHNTASREDRCIIL